MFYVLGQMVAHSVLMDVQLDDVEGLVRLCEVGFREMAMHAWLSSKIVIGQSGSESRSAHSLRR